MITSDGDFLDLDFVYRQNEKILILSDGLEGHFDKFYMREMAGNFIQKGWDTLPWNCRSCSDEINITPTLYHHGATNDLDEVIKYASSKGH